MVRVADLHTAVGDYRSLGFEVRYASPIRRAQHAHVWFSNGPIIEIVTAPRLARLYRLPATVFFGRSGAARMMRWTDAEEGFCDLALVTDTVAEFPGVLAGLRAEGVPFGQPINWKRTPPDGPVTRFRFAYPADPRLPFLVSPYEPALHPAQVAHANGAQGISAITIGVRPADRAAFDRITGGDPLLRVEPAEVTGVLGIEIDGLATEPDTVLLHGAVISAAVRGTT
jgi:hypothetical protein